MKKKLALLSIRLQSAIKESPVETFLSVFFCLLGCYFYKKELDTQLVLLYFPVFFLLSYILNHLMAKTTWRWIYYLSALVFIPFWGMEARGMSPTLLVSLVVIHLLYLIEYWKKDNEMFVKIGLRYIQALLSAWVLTFVAWLLSLSIYFSIQYIFDLNGWRDTDFVVYLSSVMYIGIMPLLFLMFNQNWEEEEDYAGSKVFNMLMNFVLSPALLVYAVLLYLYFIKITVSWSLPKGAVAYIVVSFTAAAFILKGCQVFLSKRYYDWFYRHTSLAVLPALVMYWVGAGYRINEYGYTEPRVYLIVTGAVLTGTAFLFLFKRSSHYLYAACLAVFLLSAVTYIPGITAKDIERRSQDGRENKDPELLSGADRFFTIENDEPVDIAGYETLQPVQYYETDGIWMEQQRDSLFLYNGKNSHALYQEHVDTLFVRQMHRCGLSVTDEIPESTYSKLLQLDLDSAKLVFTNFTIEKQTGDNLPYHITYMNPAYYLKRSLK